VFEHKYKFVAVGKVVDILCIFNKWKIECMYLTSLQTLTGQTIDVLEYTCILTSRYLDAYYLCIQISLFIIHFITSTIVVIYKYNNIELKIQVSNILVYATII
jgi:hypothetical protein